MYSRFKNSQYDKMTTHLVYETADPRMICGKKKIALTRHEQWLNITALEAEDFNGDMCDQCTDDPRAQLILLANTELG